MLAGRSNPASRHDRERQFLVLPRRSMQTCKGLRSEPRPSYRRTPSRRDSLLSIHVATFEGDASVTPLRIVDLFCGAGGTSTGAVQAARNLIAAHLTQRADVAHAMKEAA